MPMPAARVGDMHICALATGVVPRLLPGTPDLDGIFTLRTLEDSYRLGAVVDAGGHVVVVGAGFIGSEVAWTAKGSQENPPREIRSLQKFERL